MSEAHHNHVGLPQTIHTDVTTKKAQYMYHDTCTKNRCAVHYCDADMYTVELRLLNRVLQVTCTENYLNRGSRLSCEGRNIYFYILLHLNKLLHLAASADGEDVVPLLT